MRGKIMSVTLRANDSVNLTTGEVTRQESIMNQVKRNDLRGLHAMIMSTTPVRCHYCDVPAHFGPCPGC